MNSSIEQRVGKERGEKEMKKIYFGTNLKMYKGISETARYLSDLEARTRDISRTEIELFVLPSFTSLPDACRSADRRLIRLGAQNMCWEEQGQFTGEVSPLMLRELGLDESRAETLERFAALLLKKNEVMNLTAITEPEAVAQLHLLDSAALTRFVDLSGKTVVDVGTGAGFPGMPLRILKDDFDLTLLDSLGKRIAWLEEVCGTLGLKRVECVHARAEEFAAGHRESYDLAVSRAVAQLNVLCELALPLVKVGGQFLAMKSVGTEEEITVAKGAIRTLGGKIVKVGDYTIPTSGVTHRVVVIEKVSPTPPRYPRAFAKIKKQPL